jgi:hypothetical protein
MTTMMSQAIRTPMILAVEVGQGLIRRVDLVVIQVVTRTVMMTVTKRADPIIVRVLKKKGTKGRSNWYPCSRWYLVTDPALTNRL